MRLDAITNNPFRGVGVFAGASDREIIKQKNKLAAYTKVKKTPSVDVDFYFLDPIERTEETVKKFFSQIELPEDRLRHALFWFTVGSDSDKVILSYIQTEQEEGYKKAIDISKKMVVDKDITERNIFVVNNLGTSLLLSQNKKTIALGIQLKVKMILSPCFEVFVEKVAGSTLAINKEEVLNLFIEELIESAKKTFNEPDILLLFTYVPKEVQKKVEDRLSDNYLKMLRVALNKQKEYTDAGGEKVYQVALAFDKHISPIMRRLALLMRTQELRFASIKNEVALAFVDAGYAFFSSVGRDVANYIPKARDLAKFALKYASDEVVKDRVNQFLARVKNEEDHRFFNDVVQDFIKVAERIGATEKLDSIEIEVVGFKSQYARALSDVNQLDKESKDLFLELSNTFVMRTLNRVIKLNNEALESAQNSQDSGLISRAVLMASQGVRITRELKNYHCTAQTRQWLYENLETLERNSIPPSRPKIKSGGIDYGCLFWVIVAIIVIAIMNAAHK